MKTWKSIDFFFLLPKKLCFLILKKKLSLGNDVSLWIVLFGIHHRNESFFHHGVCVCLWFLHVLVLMDCSATILCRSGLRADWNSVKVLAGSFDEFYILMFWLCLHSHSIIYNYSEIPFKFVLGKMFVTCVFSSRFWVRNWFWEAAF